MTTNQSKRMSVCVECRHCRVFHETTSDLWECNAERHKDPVTGVVNGAVCRVRNPSGDCADFEQKQPKQSWWRRMLGANTNE